MPRFQSSPEPLADRNCFDPAVFGCALSHSGRDAAWIRLRGELDLTGAPELEQCLDRALGSARLVVVDLRQLTFMDSSAIHLIVNAHNRALRTGRRLVLVRGPAQTTHLLDLTGLTHRLELVDLDAIASRGLDAPAVADAA